LDILESAGLRLRPKTEHLENKIKLLTEKVQEFELQQPYIQILKNEILQAQQAIREAVREGVVISSGKCVRKFDR
jgi:hypothetical protein